MIRSLFHKKKLLARVKICSSHFSRCIGLMFSPPLKKGEGIILASSKEDLSAIHMFFVFFPIDVLWLDKNYKILYIKRNVKPFTPLISPPCVAQYIVELPTNSTKSLKKNDKLSLK